MVPRTPGLKASLLIVFFVLITTAAAGADKPGAAPPYFQKLIKSGKVKFQFYDPETEQKAFDGHAMFRLDIRTRYNHGHRFVGRGQNRRLQITPRFRGLVYSLRHEIVLPDSLNRDDRWDDQLLRHEFDHVAISTDPRIKLLMLHLLRRVKKINSNAGQNIGQQQIRALIDEAYSKRRNAVMELVQENYKKLDEVSSHGRVPIEDREAFFKNLYTKSNLDDAKFSYLGEVIGLLKSKKYQNAKLLYDYGEQAKGTADDQPGKTDLEKPGK